MRIESHNHPSAVEPYQGAATGVGGIIRDIFSMGARPIALMDPLRFGSLDDARTRYLFEGVVSGISGYGNSVGVPTVGGEVVFDDTYRGNPLVNVFCLGILPKERLVLARAEGPGNLAVLLGSSTGRDGIGGASVLASASFEEGDEAKRPSVQVGDPFEEKRLIEACLELLDAKLAVGVQDLGAAGLSCAASETAAKAGAGMDVDVARVSKREPGMNAVEVLTSESQERMLAIVEPANLDAVLALARRWEIRATVVGRVTDTARFRVYDGLFDAVGVPGENPAPPIGDEPPAVTSDAPPIADVPVESLGDGPLYHRPIARPAAQDALQAADPGPQLRDKFPAGADLSGELLALLATPTIADKTWVSRQYDHQLFLNTVVGPGRRCRGAAREGHDEGARARRPTARRASAASIRAPAAGWSCSKRRATSRAPGARAARARELPQLRQSRAPRSDVAVLRGRRRDERGVRGARHPGHRRQRQLLQRVGRRRHPPHAGRRRARADRRAARAPARGAVCAPATTSSCSARSGPSSAVRSGPRSCTVSTAGCRRPPTSTRPGGARARRRRSCASARSPACTT